MPLNLISDAWIPVRTSDGLKRTLRPDQVAESGVICPDWERADFNLACYELLIGLVYLADPPANTGDWSRRRKPDAVRLRDRLASLAAGFELTGDGPRFLQDLEDLDTEAGEVDMLFIDSAGGNATKKNADLLVKRNRYPGLSLPEAAMALYTFQSQAPAGGAGNRTSMRGGGPLVSLVLPDQQSDTPLWDVIWANMPDGKPIASDGLEAALPWMRPTEVSNKGQEVQPPESDFTPFEAFFGMPRRLRLDFSADASLATGVRQRPHGTNYGQWRHPLSPYYQQKQGSEWLPLHPRAGASSYRNWEGIVLERPNGLRHLASCVQVWQRRAKREKASLLIGGWVMDNMKPRDFIHSMQPLFPLNEDTQAMAIALVESANAFSLALAGALNTVVGGGGLSGSSIEATREEFYIDTQAEFEAMLNRLAEGEDNAVVAVDWCGVCRRVALRLFERIALPGLSRRRSTDIQSIVSAHARLRAAFSGYGEKTGKAAFKALGLMLPKTRKKKEGTA